MPLSSPSKGTNRAEVSAKQQAQIVDLTSQRDELVRNYMAVLRSRDRPAAPAITAPYAVETEAPRIDSAIATPTSTVAAELNTADQTEAEVTGSVSQADVEETVTHANSTLKTHIKLLYGYNEIKDIGMGLIGLIADQRGVTIAEIMEEMGVGDSD